MRIFIIFLIVTFIPGCRNNASDVKNANEVIYKLIDADNRSDIQSVLASYTDSIEFHSATKPVSKGILTIKSSYEKLFGGNRLKIKTDIRETSIDGNTAVIKGVNRGSIESLLDSSVKKVNDNYTAFLVKNGEGKWKVTRLDWSPADR